MLPYAVLPATALLLTVLPVSGMLRSPRALYLSLFPAGYLLSIIISSIAAVKIDSAILLKAVLFALTPWLVSNAARSRRSLESLTWSLWAAGMCAFAYGVYGYITGNTGDPIQHSLGYFGITYTDSTRNGDMFYLQAPFWIGLFAPDASRTHLRWWLARVTAPLLALGMVFSLGRGCWLAMAVGGISVGLRYAKTRRRRILGITAAFGALAVLLAWSMSISSPEAAERVTGRWATLFTLSEEGGNSNQARLGLARAVFDVYVSMPLGVGIGNARYHLRSSLGDVVNHAENSYLQLLLEQGPIGLIALTALLGGLIKRLAGTGDRGEKDGPVPLSLFCDRRYNGDIRITE